MNRSKQRIYRQREEAFARRLFALLEELAPGVLLLRCPPPRPFEGTVSDYIDRVIARAFAWAEFTEVLHQEDAAGRLGFHRDALAMVDGLVYCFDAAAGGGPGGGGSASDGSTPTKGQYDVTYREAA